jgi:hypothetical protein
LTDDNDDHYKEEASPPGETIMKSSLRSTNSRETNKTVRWTIQLFISKLLVVTHQKCLEKNGIAEI